MNKTVLYTFLFLIVFFPFLTTCEESVNDAANNDSISETEDLVIDNELLKSFYDKYGGPNNFLPSQRLAIETFILAQNDIEAGRLSEAKHKIDSVFSIIPVSNDRWVNNSRTSHCRGCEYNIGYPIAYYGLRMLDQITTLGIPESEETLTMTAVVAPCGDVSVPTLPDLNPIRIDLNIAPEILENDAQILKSTTLLFRTWIQSITGGLNVNLIIHELEECTTVDFFTTPTLVFSYPDYISMIDSVPDEIASQTDFWWVIGPSGVPGDGSGFNREFVTGGMGAYGDKGLPIFISDDMWFLRKPEHLGVGDYHEVERLIYHTQWFQHEFMHHLYREWPEFGLEETGHQWFDRSTWPADFNGKWEPDYYIESINKRFLDAEPSLAVGLQAGN